MDKAQKLKEEFKSDEGSIYDSVTKRYTYDFKSAKAGAINISYYTHAVKPEEDNNNQDENFND